MFAVQQRKAEGFSKFMHYCTDGISPALSAQEINTAAQFRSPHTESLQQTILIYWYVCFTCGRSCFPSCAAVKTEKVFSNQRLQKGHLMKLLLRQTAALLIYWHVLSFVKHKCIAKSKQSCLSFLFGRMPPGNDSLCHIWHISMHC